MPPVEWILAFAAVLAAAGACVVAFRSRAATRRLALEMIELRDRLARAERRYRQRKGAAGDAQREPAPARDEALRDRVTELEGRLRDALLEPTAAGPESEPDPDPVRDRIRRHLRAQGYEHVAFLGASGEDAWLVEAERDGIVSKGRAEVDGDGAVQMRADSSVRAFP
jgi:hypothetical protein